MPRPKSKRPAQKAQVKEFQRKLKILKKAGIYSGPIRVENITPTRKKFIRKYRDIISGKKAAVKLTPAQLKKIDRKKIKVIGKFAIVDNEKGFKASIKKGLVNYVKPIEGGYHEKIHLPKARNLRKLLDEIKNNPEYDHLKKGDERWSFKFYGGASYTYSNLDLLIDEFEKYETVQQALNSRGSKQADVISHFEIHRIKKGAAKKWYNEAGDSKTAKRARQKGPNERSRQRHAMRQRAYMEQMKLRGDEYKNYLAAKRIYMAKRRKQQKKKSKKK